LGQAFADIWESIRAEVSTWPGRLLQVGRDMISSLIDGITGRSVREEMFGVGGDIVGGITLGMEAAGPGLLEDTRAWIRAMEDTARDESQTQSPSRVFAAIGEDLMDGLALGVRQGGPAAEDAMRGVVTELSDLAAEAPGIVQRLGGMWGSAFSGIVRGATSARDALGRLFDQMADMVLSNAFSQLFTGLFGGLGGGGGGFLSFLFGGGFAQGGVFQSGAVVPYASGGVVSQATSFPMAGGRTGLMGEAGPEAIMPLARMASGELGVRAAAAPVAVASPGGQPLNITVHVEGANGDDHVRRLVAQGVQMGMDQLRREVPDLIEAHDADPLVRL